MTAYGRIPAGSAKYDERQFIAQFLPLSWLQHAQLSR
jgi:hypothetical protein